MTDLSRRHLLRGRLRGGPPPLRPPWSLAEERFIRTCTRCKDCLSACPEGIVVAGDGGFPQVDFSRGGCTFCGACDEACGPGAIQRPSSGPTERLTGWSQRARADESCLPVRGVQCRICEDACDPGAIRFPPRVGGHLLPHFDLDQCTGCGACVSVCPVKAISLREPSGDGR